MAKVKVDDNILSIDLGYSGVKYYFKHKGKAFFGKIPTAVKKIDDEDIYDDEVFEYNGSKYLIGEDAVDQDLNISLNAGTLIKNAPLLVYAILKFNNIEHKGLSLITGLSLKDFNDRGSDLMEILKDFTVNDEQIKLDTGLLPQGRGIAYDYFSKKPQENLALILDIGYNTFDFIAMKKDKLSIRNSFANTNGINIILNKLQYELTNQFDIKRTTTELNEAILVSNKTIKHRGEIIDFGDALKGITEDYINNIKRNINIHLVEERWNKNISANTNINGKPVVLASALFYEGTSIQVEETVVPETDKDVIKAYKYSIIPEGRYMNEGIELRVLNEDGKANAVGIKTESGIITADTVKVGSYLSFKVDSPQGEIVLIRTESMNKYIIILSFIAATAVIISGYLYYKKKKK